VFLFCISGQRRSRLLAVLLPSIRFIDGEGRATFGLQRCPQNKSRGSLPRRTTHISDRCRPCPRGVPRPRSFRRRKMAIRCPKRPPSMPGASHEHQRKPASLIGRIEVARCTIGAERPGRCRPRRVPPDASRASNMLRHDSATHDSLRQLNLSQLTHLSREGIAPESEAEERHLAYRCVRIAES
jgi:hypothetical protein